MGIFSRRERAAEPLTSVTAASQQIAPKDEERVDAHVKRVEAWQPHAWELYDEIPEVRFSARYMGDALARLDLFVGTRPAPQDDPVPLEEPDGDAELGYSASDVAACEDALERLKSPLGGRRELQRAFGVQLFVAGECYLVGEPKPPDYPDLDERWDVYSVDEVKIDPDTRRVSLREPGKTMGGRELPAQTAAYRVWRRHPRASNWADSPIRSALGILDELHLLTKAINSAATSRLKGPGIMFLPNSMRNGVVGPNQGGAATADDQFVKDLVLTASTAIRDQGSAAAQVPLLVFMDDEKWEKMGQDKLVRWDQGVDEIMAKLREELIKRFATAIDLPPEILLGYGDTNHWNAFFIGDEAFRNHIEPLAMLIVDALTVSYLRPALARMGVANPERFEIWYDPAALVADPDKGGRALDAFDRNLISDIATRRELGYSEDDAPDGADDTTDDGEDETDDAPADDDRNEEQQGPPAEHEPERDTEDAPAARVVVAAPAPIDPSLARLAKRLNMADVALLRDTHQQVDVLMRRALEKANARLLTLARRDRTAKTLVDIGGPDEPLRVAEMLGPKLVRQLTATNDDDEATEALTGVVLVQAGVWWDQRLAAEAEALLGELDVPDAQADQARAGLAEAREVGRIALMGGLFAVASRLLQKPDPGPVDLGEATGALVPPGLVRDALKAAGGGGEQAASFYTGSVIDRILRDGGYVASSWRWTYGPEAWRHRPFEPHKALDGMEFSDVNDERLGNATGGWPGVSLYWPGDHPGCLCILERTALERVERVPAPTPVLVNA